MRDRFIYEKLLYPSHHSPNTHYSIQDELPPMSVRFIDIVTPGPWSMSVNSIPFSMDGGMSLDTTDGSINLTLWATHKEVCGHPLNGFSPRRIEKLELVYEGDDDPPPAVRVRFEGTRILSRSHDKPQYGVGYRFFSIDCETENKWHFLPGNDLIL